MRRIIALAAALSVAGIGAGSAWAHAFLDHASPAVGSTVPTAPAAVTLSFTQQLEPAFSAIRVSDMAGQRVDLGNVEVPPGHPDQLQVGLRPVPAGTYTVRWHVVSVDTHPTEGTYEFRVGR